MVSDAFKTEYFKGLGLPVPPNPPEAVSVPPARPSPPTANPWTQALKPAHELRQFEIDLYWKRATYFWAFQATAFAAIGLSLKDTAIHVHVVLLASMLGTVTGCIGYLSSKGSKFWQENWESHVDLLEYAGGEGQLTQLVIVRRDIQHSVSRLNSELLCLFTLGWICMLVIFGFPCVSAYILDKQHTWMNILPLVATLAAVLYIWHTTGTRLAGKSIAAGEDNWAPFNTRVQECPVLKMWSRLLDMIIKPADRRLRMILRTTGKPSENG